MVKKDRLFIITGPPGAGKTSLAKILARKIEAEIISTSEIRQKQTKGKPLFIPEESKNAYQASIMMVKKLIDKKKNIIWEGTGQSSEAKEKIKKILKNTPRNYAVFFITLIAPPNVIRERIKRNYDSSPDKDVTPERGYNLAKSHSPFPGSTIFDTGKLSPKQIMRELLAL